MAVRSWHGGRTTTTTTSSAPQQAPQAVPLGFEESRDVGASASELDVTWGVLVPGSIVDVPAVATGAWLEGPGCVGFLAAAETVVVAGSDICAISTARPGP